MSGGNIINEEKYYVPICREKNCNGHLLVTFDENAFGVICICEKNRNHYSELYFETFERYYLKEKTIKKCFKCYNNLGNNCIYKCNQCDELYCSNCFISDKHIQEDIKNLSLLTNRCSIDQNELTNYCVDCGEKLCIFCFKKYEEKNPHKNHTIINIANNAPSIEKMKKKKF